MTVAYDLLESVLIKVLITGPESFVRSDTSSHEGPPGPGGRSSRSFRGTLLSLRVFVPEPSTSECIASCARSSLRRPQTLLRTEPPPHPRPLLPSCPK